MTDVRKRRRRGKSGIKRMFETNWKNDSNNDHGGKQMTQTEDV